MMKKLDPRWYKPANTLVFFDTETTGLDPEQNQVIQLSAIKFTLNGTTWERQSLNLEIQDTGMEPEWNPAALKVNGRTREQHQNKAFATPLEGWKVFADFCGAPPHVPEFPVASIFAFNMDFDRPFLCNMHNDPNFSRLHFERSYRKFCVKEMWMAICVGVGSTNYRLREALIELGEKGQPDVHDALWDAHAAFVVWKRVVLSLAENGLVPVNPIWQKLLTNAEFHQSPTFADITFKRK